MVDSCDCTKSQVCDTNGPFNVNQQRSSIGITYGQQQVGSGTYANNKFDVSLNGNRCKGRYKTGIAELTCQYTGGNACYTKLRCIAGNCLNPRQISVSSSMKMTTQVPILVLPFIIMFILL
ncbi:unnamed protein product [Didymodactylos carnosus]|uniref:Uncharacterized protein n=1 Tax=Didymodactylos carnosus TaxID=1234261 RepID=A0A813QEN2_9BILA|nr:unnamed protein product [Didymodactylos carnosus]CAF1206636.1 unnamed protein product [Didymodactylos carnosus]CAF3547054.1 unnamed protein product [Didymodactylos carnosus]CAF4015979.1 unnamed protein product [Didymodactylos carnosus]